MLRRRMCGRIEGRSVGGAFRAGADGSRRPGSRWGLAVTKLAANEERRSTNEQK